MNRAVGSGVVLGNKGGFFQSVISGTDSDTPFDIRESNSVVESHLAKMVVAGSSPVSRSKFTSGSNSVVEYLLPKQAVAGSIPVFRSGVL